MSDIKQDDRINAKKEAVKLLRNCANTLIKSIEHYYYALTFDNNISYEWEYLMICAYGACGEALDAINTLERVDDEYMESHCKQAAETIIV